MVTNILTPTGYKDVSELSIGDEVIAYVDGVLVTNRIQEIRRMGPDIQQDLDNQGPFIGYRINDTWTMFKNQSIWIKTGDTYNVSHVHLLQVGDVIFDDTDQEVVITSIDWTEVDEFWKFTIDGDHSYVLNGITVHNASRFWVGGGSSTNWSATANTNWSATSGGSNNATVPGVSDDATFNGLGAAGNGASVVSASQSLLTLTFTAGYTNTVTINSNVIVTIAGSFTDNTAHSWAVGNTVSGLTISATATITSGGKTFAGAIVFSGAAATKTISGNWVLSGRLSINTNVQVVNHTVAETITCFGWTSSVACSGTIDIILSGSTTSSGAAVSINSLTFAGNVTIATYNMSAGSLIYTSGTVTQSGTITFSGSVTINAAGAVFDGTNFTGAGSTITINSLLTCATMSIGAVTPVTFAGTSGITCSGVLTCTQTIASTYTFKTGVTYTFGGITASASRTGAILLFTSNDAATKTIFTIPQGSSNSILASFTRVDASGGRPISTFNGVVTDCINIVSYTDLQTLGV